MTDELTVTVTELRRLAAAWREKAAVIGTEPAEQIMAKVTCAAIDGFVHVVETHARDKAGIGRS